MKQNIIILVLHQPPATKAKGSELMKSHKADESYGCGAAIVWIIIAIAMIRLLIGVATY